MRHTIPPQNSVLSFFLLVTLLSIPFWLLGGGSLPLPMNLPVSSFMWVTPAVAAAILTYRANGATGVKRLLRAAFDARKIPHPAWYLVLLGLIPAFYALTLLLMRLTERPLPDSVEIPILTAPLLFLLFFAPAAGEELGWSGYATDPLQASWGAFRASILLGIVWQVWHVIPNLQIGHPAGWIWWHSVYSVALRVLIVWCFNHTGKSVFATILVHTMDNVSWSLFPNNGSHLDPLVLSLVAWPTVLIVVAGYGAGLFSRFRQSARA